MKIVSNFSKRLLELRLERNKTQDELAEEVGIPRVNITGWEKNHHDPKLDNVIKLALYFNVTVGYLAGFDE